MAIYDDNPQKILDIEPIITSIDEAEAVHNRLIEFRSQLYFSGQMDAQPHYRGEQKFGWDISPGLSRGKGAGLFGPQAKALESRLVSEFEKEITTRFGPQALRHLFDGQAYGRKWDSLFQAQHAGIRTTILDFSFHWERSLFFAVEESPDPDIENSDAQFWAYQYNNELLLKHSKYPIDDSFYDQDPESLLEGRMVNVPFFLDDLEHRLFEGRMFKQIGRFFIPAQDTCQIPLNLQDDIAPWLFRFRIPAEYKKPIREELEATGIDRAYLYVEENPAHHNLIAEINKRVCGW